VPKSSTPRSPSGCSKCKDLALTALACVAARPSYAADLPFCSRTYLDLSRQPVPVTAHRRPNLGRGRDAVQGVVSIAGGSRCPGAVRFRGGSGPALPTVAFIGDPLVLFPQQG